MTPEMIVLLGLHALHRRMADRIDAVNIEPPLSENERFILLVLDAPRRLGEIARLVEALPSTVSAAAGSLEAKGFVNRRQDPADGRAWLLELSPKGRAAADRLINIATDLFRQTTEFDECEMRQLADMFGRFCDKSCPQP